MPTIAVEHPGRVSLALLPPLALYVHIPWCVRKCPYCDFNSHERSGELPEREYVSKLIADLEALLPSVWGRREKRPQVSLPPGGRCAPRWGAGACCPYSRAAARRAFFPRRRSTSSSR